MPWFDTCAGDLYHILVHVIFGLDGVLLPSQTAAGALLPGTPMLVRARKILRALASTEGCRPPLRRAIPASRHGGTASFLSLFGCATTSCAAKFSLRSGHPINIAQLTCCFTFRSSRPPTNLRALDISVAIEWQIFDQLWSYSVTTGLWERFSSSERLPMWGHACSIVPATTTAFVPSDLLVSGAILVFQRHAIVPELFSLTRDV